jgi:hypothetical protein
MQNKYIIKIQKLRDNLKILYQTSLIKIGLKTLFYVAIILGLLLIYGKGNFEMPPFIYQGF